MKLLKNPVASSVLLVLVFAFLYSTFITTTKSRPKEIASEKETESRITMTTASTEIFGVKIEKNPPQSKLDELGVSTWPKWKGEPGRIPWTFKATETMYLLEGKVTVAVDGHEGSFEIGAGDLVVFPKGMKIIWDVIEAVNKRYSLEK
ncbi:hypothetical protein K2173_009768 [Erythroxylum novogranatense]|uniref:(S)-ureidoglycine aminohydrolase cupin domain-containing protein n=1 Tax=Erythroxylum novogranatense TaxID=1862640 RepID=A0AAV8T043_9ROSI|nr:hypothetical protein K2173_009768 [Erythroxylum novogranatense]